MFKLLQNKNKIMSKKSLGYKDIKIKVRQFDPSQESGIQAWNGAIPNFINKLVIINNGPNMVRFEAKEEMKYKSKDEVSPYISAVPKINIAALIAEIKKYFNELSKEYMFEL